MRMIRDRSIQFDRIERSETDASLEQRHRERVNDFIVIIIFFLLSKYRRKNYRTFEIRRLGSIGSLFAG